MRIARLLLTAALLLGLASSGWAQVRTGEAIVSTEAQITGGSGTGVTIVDAGSLRTARYAVTVDETAFDCAAVTCDLTLATLPAGVRLEAIYLDLTETFACASTCTTSTLSITVGSSAGGTNLLVSLDADSATALFGDADAELGAGINRANAIQGGFLGSWSTTTPISLRLTSGTGNLGDGAGTTNLSQGTFTVYLVTTALQ